MATYCTKCNTTPAYISYLGNCECSNPTCEFYSRDLYPPSVISSVAATDPPPPRLDQNEAGEEEIEHSPVYLWATHHHDFGD
jgi:hypothetical protein